MFVRSSRDSESQDATKLTSALKDSRNHSLMKMMTLCICLVAITIFLSDNVDIEAHWCLQNQSVDVKFC